MRCRTHSAILMVVAMLALSACAMHPVRVPLPAVAGDAAANQARRESILAEAASWTLAGRVALSTAQHGGSGRIDWHQGGGQFDISLSAPVTRQSWRLSGERGHARLEGLDGGPREGADASVLLREATGWEIPVDALSAWARGMSATDAGAAQMQFGPDRRLARIDQGGWTIEYRAWAPQPGLGIELPTRLDASRGDARVRLVVDTWSEGAAAP